MYFLLNHIHTQVLCHFLCVRLEFTNFTHQKSSIFIPSHIHFSPYVHSSLISLQIDMLLLDASVFFLIKNPLPSSTPKNSSVPAFSSSLHWPLSCYYIFDSHQHHWFLEDFLSLNLIIHNNFHPIFHRRRRCFKTDYVQCFKILDYVLSFQFLHNSVTNFSLSWWFSVWPSVALLFLLLFTIFFTPSFLNHLNTVYYE